jgi:hypothetical protein
MTRALTPRGRKAVTRAGRRREVHDYDRLDTTGMIDPSKPLRLEDLGLSLPPLPPTQVVSIRLPSALLNEIKALGSERDVPYQSLIKLFLAESVTRMKKKTTVPERNPVG